MKRAPHIALAAAAVCCSAGLVGVPQASATALSTVHSTSFAGYSASDPSPVTTFSGTLTVPAFTCPAAGQVYLDATVSMNSVTGQGADFGWSAYCYNGTANYESASVSVQDLASLLVGANIGIAPGQSVRATITQNAKSGKTTVAIKNLTTLASATGNTPNLMSFSEITAGLSDQNYSGVGITIPSFTKATFGSLLFNGATLATLSPTKSNLYNGTTLQVATSAISAGGTFSAVFKHV